MLCFDSFYQSLEYFGLVFSEGREHFAIEGNVVFLKSTHKCRIGITERAHRCIDADAPEIASKTLFGLAVAEGVAASVRDSFFGHALFG